MILHLLRLSSAADSTLGVLYHVYDGGKRKFLSFTLEDEYREEKVRSETRIPAGTYDICLRTVGGYHARYKNRFRDIHKGMLWLQDVPNFEYILIHCGNTEEHTAGCLLVGYDPKRVRGGEYELYKSTMAYMNIYPAIAQALEDGEHVTIKIIDFDEAYKRLG